MRKFGLSITITIVIGLAFRATAQDTPPATPQAAGQPTAQPTGPAPQYFMLNLPAGASLISAPLDTGQGLARDAFLGLPLAWPLFWGWDSTSQVFLGGDQAPAAPARGYEVFLPAPATLVVAGQPYSYFTSLTQHIHPGWHLFGVPFVEGIDWKDFKLHVSGNPISLDTAVDMGWIDPQLITMQGSQVQYHTPGQPLVPGEAYWIRTSVPFDMRAERSAGTSLATVANAQPKGALTAASSTYTAASSTNTAASSTYKTTSAMGWLGAIADFLVDAAKGAVQIAEGNFVAAGFEFAAGTFGLVEYGLGESSAPTDQLTKMDAKLDTLIGDVNAISGQLTGLEGQIAGLENYIISDTKLGQYILEADVWLGLYYQGPRNTKQSREWARWKLAGCDTGNLLVTACPESANPVTTDNYNSFTTNFIQLPGSTNNVTDDFPLWWAYSVLGGQNGVLQWVTSGTSADGLVDFIYHGLTDKMGTSDNALFNYMHTVFLADAACANDVSNPGIAGDPLHPKCDLLNQVYLPVEAYFLKAIGNQTQLVAAQAEAKTVLAVKYAKTHPGAGQNDVRDLMAKTNGYLNQEAEAFLQVAEYIALFRAADGQFDWNNFGASDAGQILARADFLVARLAGQNYQTNPPADYVNPPWPSQGVVGRVFYVSGESALSKGGTRGVCACTSPTACASQAFCANPVGQVAEDGLNRTVTGEWPYLLWKTSSGAATGAPASQWTVQRLIPTSLSPSLYAVDSTSPERLGAHLFVGTYDKNYNNLAPAAGGSITFGSLNAIEGAIGHYGLKLGQSPWTTTGGETNAEYKFSVSYSDTADALGAAYLDVTFPPIPTHGTGFNGTIKGPWSASANIKLDASSLAAPFTHVRVHWPTTVKVNLHSTVPTWSQNIFQPHGCDATVPYYSSIGFGQQLLDKNNKMVVQSAVPTNFCSSAPFATCIFQGDQSIEAGSQLLTAGSQYTFKASFSAETYPYSKCLSGAETWRSSQGKSEASWVIESPALTLTKQ